MDSQRIEQFLRLILDKCGEEIIHNHNRFQSAMFDLLDEIHYSNERMVFRHAMESKSFWILLETIQITEDSAKKAIGQIQQESRMTKEDAEFVVRCVLAAYGGKTDIVTGNENSDDVKRVQQKEEKNTLMKDCPDFHQYSGTVLGSKISRDSIISVTFKDELKTMPDTAWDVSWNRDGSVMAWTKRNHENGQMFDLFIGAEGGIKAKNCCGLFAYYKNVETIDFKHSFDTSQVTDMSQMFSKCGNLRKLDISGFDTSRVTDMSRMFVCCSHLTELDISSFDTSRVTRMKSMFMECGNLRKLDVSKFNTSQVTDMGLMFLGCGNLEELDISKFDTSQVTDMGWMFMRCGITAEEAGFRTG